MVRNFSHFSDEHYHFPADGEGKGPVILIVEDEVSLGSALERALKYVGYDALSVPSALEALSLLHIRCPRLAIVDVNLPDIDGIKLIQAIRKEPGCERVPVIVYTGDFSPEKQRAARAAGADHYLVKGTITMQQLVEKVGETLRTAPGPYRFSS